MTHTTKKRLRIALLILVVIVVVMQLIQTNHNNGTSQSPNDITHAVDVPASVLTILQTSCYDCHSNHTNYPWYAHIQPTGWWLTSHINDGKSKLNFSEFNTYEAKRKNKKLEDIAEEVEKRDMPLNSYLVIHTQSRLSKSQAEELISWAKSTKAL